jgi:hypothetical protein
MKKPKIKNPKAKPYKAANRELKGPINKATKVIQNKKRLSKPPKGE